MKFQLGALPAVPIGRGLQVSREDDAEAPMLSRRRLRSSILPSLFILTFAATRRGIQFPNPVMDLFSCCSQSGLADPKAVCSEHGSRATV